MKTELIEEIAAILPEGRTKYFYFKEKYAVDLMRYFAAGRSVADVKASRFAGLLKKAVVKDVLSGVGTGRLNARDFENVWGNEVYPFLLTIGQWGHNRHAERNWYQTTGCDANLVLQLNFSNLHNAPYQRSIDDRYRPFEFSAHPVARPPYRTLAWARIDLSFETDEALIEEVQTDWVRYAKNRLTRISHMKLEEMGEEDRKSIPYFMEVLPPYAGIWQEAILAAALWFIREELGLSKVYYHTHASGCKLKRIDTNLPPRSLYESLPRKFCFKRTGEVPRFLERYMKRKANAEFYRLDFKKGLEQ
ncbi:hypothetical protein [Pelagicoccus mobilis]|uniref:Uncharacterized protein n=1 Tax=Pelagicoccus mobilis TaxID=415221 RepID=A0A934S1G6_9BACT|nr:hypothetical protein [Pelagicoccus mobilis]MBK1877368.1 hypothetical protein [Pelagicoccus mobilis]